MTGAMMIKPLTIKMDEQVIKGMKEFKRKTGIPISFQVAKAWHEVYGKGAAQ
jgi:hypothetical protein